ncbi:hypothetical protein U27_05886 [Candidatus Vecturithrix granuli]|uniref:4Fe-4S ferredoxin-type domain-containing protein n=1 Tax=Vecturithrix granuli TaxID=1499967 RepID=A0A081C2V6_VECG1|nr:hypothetical protein U27_05886 [Candidatus Vecturithrix granuli]
MSTTFQPIPFGDLIKRVFYEHKQYGKIFGLARDDFFLGFPGEQLGVEYLNQQASTPYGPAAGPHTQLAQNIVLAWLTGARIIELKTLSDTKTRKFPTPHVDTQNLGFNLERSSEISVEAAVQEYVKAWMLIEMIKHSQILGEEFSQYACHTIFELSVGYDYKGIKSERLSTAIRTLKNAQPLIDTLREDIPKEFSNLQTLDYAPNIIDSVTLATFHGCSSDEIDNIVSHLLTEHQLNVIIKLNPTLLDREEVEHTFHKILGYQFLQIEPSQFDTELHFDQAIAMLKNMHHVATVSGKILGLKLVNSLLVKNYKGYLAGETMRLSGPPLHVLALLLLQKIRDQLGSLQAKIPIAFSGGVDDKNIADIVCLNLAPVTVCTDLLKPPGYAKGVTYLHNLGERMQIAEAINIPDYIMKRFEHEADAVCDVFTRLFEEVQHLGMQLPEEQRDATIKEQVHIFKNLRERVLSALKENNDSLELLTTDALIITDTLSAYHHKFGESFLMPHTFKDLYLNIVSAAASRNLEKILEQALYGPYYSFANHKQVPEKLPSELGFYDCASCGRCIGVCPNNANFVYHIVPTSIDYVDYRVMGAEFHEVGGSQFIIENSYQIANYIPLCNECSVCGLHCVEHGHPYRAKPRYFASQEQWDLHKDVDGFFVEKDGELEYIAGRIYGQEYRLWQNTTTNHITYADGIIEAVFEYPDHRLVRTMALTNIGKEHILDMKVYYMLFTQLQGVLNNEDCNPINIKYQSDDIRRF